MTNNKPGIRPSTLITIATIIFAAGGGWAMFNAQADDIKENKEDIKVIKKESHAKDVEFAQFSTTQTAMATDIEDIETLLRTAIKVKIFGEIPQ